MCLGRMPWFPDVETLEHPSRFVPIQPVLNGEVNPDGEEGAQELFHHRAKRPKLWLLVKLVSVRPV